MRKFAAGLFGVVAVAAIFALLGHAGTGSSPSAAQYRPPVGRLALYLVNAGPGTTTFWHAGGGNCDPFDTAAELSTTKGSNVRQESVYGTFLSYDTARAFTVPASPDAIILSGWWSSGDGTCPGQTGNQTVFWRVTCDGPTCGSAELTSGYQFFLVPSGTVTPTIFNPHSGPTSPVSVGVGDRITIELGSFEWPVLWWNAPKGAGATSLDILQQ